MSKIHEIAVAIRDCSRVMSVADARTEMLRHYGDRKVVEGGPMVSVLKDHAERVWDDASAMRSALEEELTVHAPQTVGDVLTQVLVVADYSHSRSR